MSSRPNILFFMTDQQQAQVTLPNHPCKTPNIDRFSKEGVAFTSTYTTMAHCCPARASLMTGLYPSQHGIFNNVNNEQALSKSINPGVEMFSEKLKGAGYDMFYSGKWHVSHTENPSDRGWEELVVTAKAGSQRYKTTKQRFVKMEPDYSNEERERGEIIRRGWGNYRLYGTLDQNEVPKADKKIFPSALEKLEQLKDNQNPWCLFISLNGPHDPFIIPEEYAKMYNPEDISLPPNYHDELKDKPALYRRMRKVWDQLSEEEVKESIAHYWGFCTMMDKMFGQVLDTLENNGQKENTIVVYLSDHGEHLGAHGIYLKGLSTFEEGYRVPCIIRWPEGANNPGRTIHELVSIMDIAPTVIEASGSEPLSKCMGRSLMPFLKDEKPDNWRDSIYAQCNGVEVYMTRRMVVDSNYKFVYSPTDVDELYDLKDDPHEMKNLADDPEYQKVKRQMLKKMWEHVIDSEDTVITPYATVAVADLGPGCISWDID